MKSKNETRINRIKARCDIFHDQDKVLLRMEMPGVTKDSLDVRIDKDMLIIRANKSTGPRPGTYRLREIQMGEYYHEFTLDSTIDKNKIDAAISNGIVNITLFLKESEKPRQIEVTAG